MPGQNIRDGHQPIPTNVWSAHHLPAAATQATATQAAPGAGKRNVITWLTVVLSSNGSAPTAAASSVSAIDGGTGGTTYLWRAAMSIAATAGLTNGIALSNLWMPGSVNTATTLEFTANAGANTVESVSFGGVIVEE